MFTAILQKLTARQDLTALFGRHPDEEPVGPLPVAAIRLKCAYALGHDC